MQLLAGYLAGMGFISAAIGGSLTAKLPLVTTALGLLLLVFTIVFSLLDNRTRELVKVAESAILSSLDEFDENARSRPNVVTVSAQGQAMSYRKAFVRLYYVSGIFALASIALAWTFSR
jgi:hypothetical protein